MSRVEKIQQEILSLPQIDYVQLRQWFSELDWEKWDRQIEADSNAGKLDFLIAEALERKREEDARGSLGAQKTSRPGRKPL